MVKEVLKPLSKKQMDVIRQKLLDEKKMLLQNLGEMVEEFGLISEDVNDELEAAIADDQGSQLLRFKNRESTYLKKVDKTLKKIDRGEYGECCECGGLIKFERLLARPTAEMCILCKEEAEREENSSVTGRQSKSLGKSADFRFASGMGL